MSLAAGRPKGHGPRWTVPPVAGQPRQARPAARQGRSTPVIPAGCPPLARVPSIHVKVTDTRAWRDRHLRFHFYDQLGPSPDIGDLLRRSTATRSRSRSRSRWRSSGDSPSRLRRPQYRCLAARLPIGAARHPVSLGYDSSGIPRTARDHSRNPGGCDLAEVALADLPMAPPGTVRPHHGLYRLFDFFSNISCELWSPVTESNRRPSPYHGHLTSRWPATD
jgi:hypothetical protein